LPRWILRLAKRETTISTHPLNGTNLFYGVLEPMKVESVVKKSQMVRNRVLRLPWSIIGDVVFLNLLRNVI
jgi:hypothetical protein